jgi:hypothetical protein
MLKLDYTTLAVNTGKKNLLIFFTILGLDVDNASLPYGASIPIEKAADPRGDVLLGMPSC